MASSLGFQTMARKRGGSSEEHTARLCQASVRPTVSAPEPPRLAGQVPNRPTSFAVAAMAPLIESRTVAAVAPGGSDTFFFDAYNVNTYRCTPAGGQGAI